VFTPEIEGVKFAWFASRMCPTEARFPLHCIVVILSAYNILTPALTSCLETGPLTSRGKTHSFVKILSEISCKVTIPKQAVIMLLKLADSDST
jgi:hypothetical protein